MDSLIRLLETYYLGACLFQAGALAFIGFDARSRPNRLGWMFFTLFTGPIGLSLYVILGRR